MNNRDFILDCMQKLGVNLARDLQNRAPDMTGTEIYEEENYVPDFNPQKQYLNYQAGFICKSPSGRIVKLIQPYDSQIYSQDPEELSAQWGFYWSTNPDKALPFISLATSPYNEGDCCIEDNIIWRSLMNNNVFSPSNYPEGWEQVGVKNV